MFKLARIVAAIGLIALLVSVSAPSAEARGRGGLNVSIYDYSGEGVDIGLEQPWRSGSIGTRCARTVFATIDQDFDPPFEDCPDADILVHYSGYLKVPRTGVYTFYGSVDDGFHMKLDRKVVLNDWEVQGADLYNVGGDIRLRGRQAYEVNAWLFQFGGPGAARLYYSFRGSDPQLVPASWFSTRR